MLAVCVAFLTSYLFSPVLLWVSMGVLVPFPVVTHPSCPRPFSPLNADVLTSVYFLFLFLFLAPWRILSQGHVPCICKPPSHSTSALFSSSPSSTVRVTEPFCILERLRGVLPARLRDFASFLARTALLMSVL